MGTDKRGKERVKEGKRAAPPKMRLQPGRLFSPPHAPAPLAIPQVSAPGLKKRSASWGSTGPRAQDGQARGTPGRTHTDEGPAAPERDAAASGGHRVIPRAKKCAPAVRTPRLVRMTPAAQLTARPHQTAEDLGEPPRGRAGDSRGCAGRAPDRKRPGAPRPCACPPAGAGAGARARPRQVVRGCAPSAASSSPATGAAREVSFRANLTGVSSKGFLTLENFSPGL